MAQNTQKNSFVSLLEQIAVLNKNSVEIITKLNDVVGSNKSSVKVNYQEIDGTTSSFELPTVGYLKNEIDIANSNIKMLSNLEGDNSVTILDSNNNSRKIKSIDVSREPDQISSLDISTQFKQTTNWFFDGLINPTLSIEMNLSGKISDNVTKILSRRYIVKFEKDSDGVLTVNGSNSFIQFQNTFLNRNDFTIEDFTTWLNSSTNYGVIKEDENLYKDEQYFDLNYKVVNYKGYFSVLSLQRDDINNKLWYNLNSLTYYDRNGGTRTLSIGDVLTINNKKSYTKYKILEVNTASSMFRISVERIEGYDPIPIGTNVLEYYSTLESQTTVNISIGFDEYNVIFIKSINTDNNIICSDWSKGMSFYTNDLVLSSDNNVNMSDFYLTSVRDYGLLLKDMVTKKIPSQFGTTPNKPLLVSDNFKVVQINKHLTDTKDFDTLKKLHSQKNSVKSKLNEIQESITQKNMELNLKSFKSVAEKSRAQNELNKLITQQESETKMFSSYVNQITNSSVEVFSDPKFRIRGFWDIPDPIIKSGYKSQEVIAFEIQCRYGSKTGADNATEGMEMKSSSLLTKKKTAYFSNWNSIKTDIRKRVYDETTDTWMWEIEDTSNADTPNINQLDIAIQKGEKVDIRIRSISEVGYPETPLMSDWSEVITIEFPTELGDVLGENQFILKEATQEEMRVQFEGELNSKGINKHVLESFYINEQYYAHTDKTISTSFKDTFGNTLSLFEYLKQMNDKISALEETIKRAKGELKIVLYKGTQEIEITNGSKITINVQCEDYMQEIAGSTQSLKKFQNNVYLIDDYQLSFKNVAIENGLGLLSYKLLTDFQNSIVLPVNNCPTMISADGKLYNQKDNQYIWLLNKATINGTPVFLYNTGATLNSDYINCSTLNNNTLIDNTIWSVGNTIGATVHPYVESTNLTNELVDNSKNGLHIIDAQQNQILPLKLYFKPLLGTNPTFEIITTTTPIVLKKALCFYVEEENSNRAFEFTIIFNITRHKQYAVQGDFISTSYQSSNLQ